MATFKFYIPAINLMGAGCLQEAAADIKGYGHRKALIKDQNIRLGGKEVTAPNRAVLMNKLAQICCGAVLDKDGEPVELQPTRRLEECNYIMGQAEGKVLIFVPFRAAVQTVAEYLRKQG